MKKMVICTVGTSIADKCASKATMEINSYPYDQEEPIFEQEIAARIRNLDGSRRRISAEINTLDRIGLNNDDRIILLSSDNNAGRICSDMLKSELQRLYELPQGNIEIRRIEGLQVKEAKRLREVGLKNFVSIVMGYLRDAQNQYQYETILNPTGGFKGVLPFLTILGMLFGKKSIYIFEHSEELVHLPPLPLTFNLEIFNRVKPALQYIEQENAVNVEAFLNKIDGYDPIERDLFLSFTEPLDNQVTLSPLAYILSDIDKNRIPTYVLPAILPRIRDLAGIRGEVLKRLLAMAANPLWRTQHIHRWKNTDLLVIKQGRTAERLAGFIENSSFYVTDAYSDHDDYERNFGNFRKSDYNIQDFVEWVPADDEIILDLETENIRLKAENTRLRGEINGGRG